MFAGSQTRMTTTPQHENRDDHTNNTFEDGLEAEQNHYCSQSATQKVAVVIHCLLLPSCITPIEIDGARDIVRLEPCNDMEVVDYSHLVPQLLRAATGALSKCCSF